MLRTSVAVTLFGLLVAAPAEGQERRASAATLDPVVLELTSVESPTATIRGQIRLSSTPGSQPAQRGGYVGGKGGDGVMNHNSSRSNKTYPLAAGESTTIDLELSQDVATAATRLEGGAEGAMGDPVPGIDVMLEQIPGGNQRTSTTSTDGVFTFDHVPPGTYVLRWTVKGRPFVQPVDVGIKEEGVR